MKQTWVLFLSCSQGKSGFGCVKALKILPVNDAEREGRDAEKF